MSFMLDITSVIKASQDLPCRTLILVDTQSDKFVQGHFVYPYDTDMSLDAVKQLFAFSFKVLEVNHNPSREFNLPIIQYVGRWKVTVVIQDATGKTSILDGLALSTDAYMGVGG